MARMILRRLAHSVGTLVFVSLLIFTATQLLPGDVAEVALGQNATPETLEALREELGVNEPVVVRYVSWLGQIAQGDLGKSFVSGRKVSSLIASRLPATLLLGGVTALIALPLAFGCGLYAAARAGSLVDKFIINTCLVTASGPEFMFATLLILFFSVQLDLLPVTSYVSSRATLVDHIQVLILPAITLVLAIFAGTTRMTRSAVLNVMGSPYIEMALLKGVPRARILARHALPNAIGPVANTAGISLGYLLSGVVVVETIFSYPGMAKLMVDSVALRDLPVVQGCALVFGVVYVGLNLVTDIIATVSNPQLRSSQ